MRTCWTDVMKWERILWNKKNNYCISNLSKCHKTIKLRTLYRACNSPQIRQKQAMMGREKEERVRDRTSQRKRDRGSQVLPVATTALHHFFIFLSGIPSLWCSLSLSLSLSPSSHPSPPSSLWQSIWPTQPCHPFNLSVLAMAPISHWLVFVAGAGRTRS